MLIVPGGYSRLYYRYNLDRHSYMEGGGCTPLACNVVCPHCPMVDFSPGSYFCLYPSPLHIHVHLLSSLVLSLLIIRSSVVSPPPPPPPIPTLDTFREGHVDVINLLLDTDPLCWRTVSKNGRTPLHTACEERRMREGGRGGGREGRGGGREEGEGGKRGREGRRTVKG